MSDLKNTARVLDRCRQSHLFIFALILRNLFAFFLINSLTVFLWSPSALLAVGGLTTLFWNLFAMLIINCLAAFLRNLKQTLTIIIVTNPK